MTARIDLIHELVSSAAAAVPDRPAIISPDGTAVTFAQFDRQVGSVAAWVSERTRRGGRVAVIADNSAAYARLYYGVPRSGRVLVLINQRLSAGEQATQLTSAAPTVLVGDARYLNALPEIPEPSLDHVVAFDDPEWQRAEHEPGDCAEPVGPEDPAWLLFTSGSTGVPKGVLHTHRSITTAVRGTVAGRSVRSGGENVSSREVEDVLSSHPDVDQVAVVGVPDEYWGEAICAVVVAGSDRHPSAETLVAHVRSNIAAFKRPRHVLFVDALPLTSNGKVAKDAVRQYARTEVS